MAPITPTRIGSVEQAPRQSGGTPLINLTSTELNRLVYDVRSRLNQAQNGFSTRPVSTEESQALSTTQPQITKTPLNLQPEIPTETYRPAVALAPGANMLEVIFALGNGQLKTLAAQANREQAALNNGGKA